MDQKRKVGRQGKNHNCDNRIEHEQLLIVTQTLINFQSTPTMQEETGSSLKIQQLTPPNAMVLPTGPNPVYTKRSLTQDMRSQENTHLPFNNLSEVSAKFPHHQVTRPNHGELVQHGLVPNNSHVSQHPQHQYHQQIAS